MDTLARDGGEGVRYVMVAIGNFYTNCRSNPYRKHATDRINICIKINISVNGYPKQLYSDGESSFRAKVFFRFINGNDIKHIQTSTHAPSAERFLRTFKNNLYRRLDGLKQDKSDWVKHVEISLTNIKIQNITQLKLNH